MNLPPQLPLLSLKKVEHGLDEQALKTFAFEIARELEAGYRVLLEGEMGSGKTTLAKMILELLGIKQAAEGSPTYAISHEYDADIGKIIHCDFYRLRSEVEIVEAGLEESFFVNRCVIIAEWVSKFPNFENEILENTRLGQFIKITLSIPKDNPDVRDVQIETNGY